MNVGYLRLSRDDDKRNYTSIENQQLIIEQVAGEMDVTIDRWFIDDGVSGYIFERPGFQEMMSLLDQIEMVFVKDFSRLGRHNAKVLLLLDEFQEREVRLIAVDDHYDTADSEDDVIGIKTWFNERYVKDTSKKIRSAIGAKQKTGTLLTLPPFGYSRNEKDNTKVDVVPEEAEIIKLVFHLYVGGMGYRKIAIHLNETGTPTPSMRRREREVREGHLSNKSVATQWSDSMVKEILDNDYYIGVLRTKKRERKTVHGKDRRVPKEEQFVFENHHEAIIDTVIFEMVQEIKDKRNRNRYRGSQGQWEKTQLPNPFSGCLFCKDCGSYLTPVKRVSGKGQRKYYICSKYNTKGKAYCSKAHLIEEEDLMRDVIKCLSMCRDALCDVISTYDLRDLSKEKKSVEETRQEIQEQLDERQKQLRVLLQQKVIDISGAGENADLIKETYESVQMDLLAQIKGFENQLEELNDTGISAEEMRCNLESALDVVDKVIAGGKLEHWEIELLVDRIDVDENGMPDIHLKYGLSGLVNFSPVAEAQRRENETICLAMKLIAEDERGYTSAKSLAQKMTDSGIPMSKKAVLKYLNLARERGIIVDSGDPLKPYTIIMDKSQILELFPDAITYTGHNLHGYEADRRHAGNGI